MEDAANHAATFTAKMKAEIEANENKHAQAVKSAQEDFKK